MDRGAYHFSLMLVQRNVFVEKEFFIYKKITQYSLNIKILTEMKLWVSIRLV